MNRRESRSNQYGSKKSRAAIPTGKVERQDLRDAIQKLKTGKIHGFDGITAEILKYCIVMERLLWIFNLAWKSGERPED